MRRSEARSVPRKTASPWRIHVAWACAILSHAVSIASGIEMLAPRGARLTPWPPSVWIFVRLMRRQENFDVAAALQKKFRRVTCWPRNRSRPRHYDVKILSHVWFLCALCVSSFSVSPVAQGFLRCCLTVTGNGFPHHGRFATRARGRNDACRRWFNSDFQ